MKPGERLTAGYAHPASADSRAFRVRDDMERLAKLRESDPQRYQRLSASQKMALGYYLNDKEAYEAAEAAEGEQT